jgi:hypothetical protein
MQHRREILETAQRAQFGTMRRHIMIENVIAVKAFALRQPATFKLCYNAMPLANTCITTLAKKFSNSFLQNNQP